MLQSFFEFIDEGSGVAVKTASHAASLRVCLPCFPWVTTELSLTLSRDTLELKHVSHSDRVASSAFTGPFVSPLPFLVWARVL